MGLRADGRYLLRCGGRSPVMTTDRTGMYQLSRAASAGAAAGWPP
jgi:hypothetical protein